MSLTEWQRALRRQVAQEENMECSEPDAEHLPGEYNVTNIAKSQTYKVVYRGEDCSWNYCSCMDFKTSHLGTCKHIERVKIWIEDNNLPLHTELPPYSSVYLSYTDGRQVKIRVGSYCRKEFMALAERYFDEDGVMLPNLLDEFDVMFIDAKKIDPSFRFYQDAIDYIIEQRERKFREEIIKGYTDEKLDTLLATKLFPYQKEGVKFAFRCGRSIIADEMGLGKTVQAIATAEMLRDSSLAENVMVVCPTSLKYQWQREIERFVPGATTIVVEGTPDKRKQQYESSETYKIVSYNCVAKDVRLLEKLHADILIMDEVQRLKNWKTQISMAARKIQSDYAVILSGTPLENRLEELYTVMEFADSFLLSPFWQFKADCILTDGGGKVIGYQNLNKIGEKVSGRLIRRTKKQVALQMPRRMDKNLLVAMTDKQKEVHDELKSQVAQLVLKWRRLHFLPEKDRQKLLILLSQMRMVCDSTYILDQQSRHDTKVDETMDILQPFLEEGDEKVVVFSQWERMTRLIAAELDKIHVNYVYLHGGIPSSKRKDIIATFTDDSSCRVFLSTDAGSTGLNLQAASMIINLDLPWNPAVLEQRIARIYRLGQERNIQVINLISKESIEDSMLDKLRFKSAMFEGVLDNGEDTIYMGDKSNFEMMMDTLSDAMDDTKKTRRHTGNDSLKPSQTAAGDGAVAINTPDDNSNGSHRHGAAVSTARTQQPQPQQELSPQDLLAHGMAFFSGLAKTLQSPEDTQKLVDSIVETDAQTGQSHLKIPVPNKETVGTLLGALGKLFAK
ncbi:MAG: DEAD/DEAH box helicase family protein [Bacteroidales bacterium]|nr:DEAD/DEAH box helicase family protein [Bacteroidales bacterium]